jgi:UDP-4-amino-4,6-dideoxy-N-acetyl-beta-L-altrosamine transaminase
MIPYGRQSISEADIDAVVRVLRSDYLTQGPMVPAFERALAARCGARHAVALSNATAALHVACLALGVGPGDRVWTSPVTFVASANCALYCGATVDFVDVDPRTYNLCPVRLEEKLQQAAAVGGLPKVVVAVHLCGQPPALRQLRELADRYGFKIIEDASHAVGATYEGAPVGNGAYSDITIFSFHPVKIITTGEGGMALTNDPGLARRMELLRSHGITREQSEMTEPAHGEWYYQQVALGFNYRMTELQAALGLSQLDRLDEFVAARRRLAARYDAALKEVPVTRPWQDPAGSSAWHLYVVMLDRTRVSSSHRDVFSRLRRSGIGVNLHYIPVYLQPYYRRLGFAPGHCPEAENYYQGAISLPLYPDLTDGQQDQVVAALATAIAAPAS